MNAIIIEDETVAAQSLQRLINELEPEITIIDTLQSIEDSVEWFEENAMPDLVFMDIHLADGSSFAIFDKTEITCPIIFTTAYDEYALKAFEVNSIDYLLKPIGKEDLQRALNKFKAIAPALDGTCNDENLQGLIEQMNGKSKKYKSCFLLPERDKLVPLATKNIACICIDTKMVKITSLDGRSYFINQTLDDLMNQLDPNDFFRANRQYIIARSAVKDFSVWFGNKLVVNLTVDTPERIVISKAKVTEIKTWFSE